jgi:hypothetical protein
MNKANPGQPPSSTGPSAESTAKDRETELEVYLRHLIGEIFRLARSGQDPARLSKLEREFDDFRLWQVERGLALLERGPDLASLLEWHESAEARKQPYHLALRRTDLTVPELIFLKKLTEQNLEESRQALLAEKESIERERHPGRRRKRTAR